eukprot:UN25802
MALLISIIFNIQLFFPIKILRIQIVPYRKRLCDPFLRIRHFIRHSTHIWNFYDKNSNINKSSQVRMHHVTKSLNINHTSHKRKHG